MYILFKCAEAKKKVAVDGLCRHEVRNSERSAADADPAEKVNWENNGIICKFSPNAKTHRSCAADCIRYAWHRRTPKARMRYWGRRRERKMCVDRGMANGRTDDSLFSSLWLEFF